MKDKKRGFFYSLFRGLNLIRLIIINLIFFILLFLCIAGIYKYNDTTEKQQNTRITVYADSLLLINPAGRLTEKPDEFIWRNYLLSETVSDAILLSDITDALRHAAHDRRITAVLLDLTGLYGISSGHFTALKAALLEYKDSNKPLYAFSTSYGSGRYYIASFADHIYLDPMGEVNLSGFSTESLFYGEMEKKFGIQWNAVHAGAFKSMAETYTRTGMSAGVRNNHLSVFKDLWQTYIQDIATNRTTDASTLESYAERYSDALQKTNGDSAQAALDANLITDIGTYEECGVALGVLDEETYNLSERDFINYNNYNKSFKKKETDNQIGVIYLTGSITGTTDNTAENADSSTLIDLFDEAASNDSIKAVVLRIDSGGGEVNASEDIRRSVERLSKKIGKPVVVSMGSIAASGAYWIASAADYIFCSPYTITGSIGVFAVSPTIQNAVKEYFGIHVDGVSTTGRMPYSLFRNLTDEERTQSELEVMHTYSIFLDKVAHGRNLPRATVEELAQGKIYSGTQAKELQLADELGSFTDAVNYAATKSGIKETYSLKFLYKTPPIADEILKTLLAENARFYKSADLQVLHELFGLRSKKDFYVYTPIKAPIEE
ncbi:signal peptide peptidase SppA [Treponema medium]|uniref:signal peptide peptidase SppA n=1 Tax=Treponema medium TaxID=58231 RepID=UPI0019812726|nr:signal peptide peptidase SppA [Treponema medium]QSH92254.1 signal peptide peptidase SppA [Treponema medium]QSH92392.1 signal peptide peptidase SppA [Treponema medium]